jgi:pyrroline-5-carboxylate reductase
VSAPVRYGVLGVGALAAAVVRGLCLADAPPVLLSPRNAATAAGLAAAHPTVTVAGSNQEVLDGSDVVLVCLRQRDAADALAALRWRPDHAVVSPMPGFTVPELADLCAPATEVARAIAMPALATRSATTVVHPPTPSAVALFDGLGGTIRVEDVAVYEALYTASATVAPYFAYLSTLADWLVDRGADRSAAQRHLSSIFAGVLPPLAEYADPDFAELAAEYATPGGVNEQVTTLLRERGVYGDVREVLDEVHGRLTGREDADAAG